VKALLLVAIGGAFGSVTRFKLSEYVVLHTADWRFPAGTFAVNVLGCLLAGLLAGLAERHAIVSPQTQLLLFVGVLGGFTTFSAFGLETVILFRRGELLVAAANIASSVVVGVAALWLGMKLGSLKT